MDLRKLFAIDGILPDLGARVTQNHRFSLPTRT